MTKTECRSLRELHAGWVEAALRTNELDLRIDRIETAHRGTRDKPCVMVGAERCYDEDMIDKAIERLRVQGTRWAIDYDRCAMVDELRESFTRGLADQREKWHRECAAAGLVQLREERDRADEEEDDARKAFMAKAPAAADLHDLAAVFDLAFWNATELSGPAEPEVLIFLRVLRRMAPGIRLRCVEEDDDFEASTRLETEGAKIGFAAE